MKGPGRARKSKKEPRIFPCLCRVLSHGFGGRLLSPLAATAPHTWPPLLFPVGRKPGSKLGRRPTGPRAWCLVLVNCWALLDNGL
ncbi:hypothetical protein NDU88_007273 [Pleurodeles waltl]|uniref:Uncharacterized protein n=1 Tax=Pleurodeles waltl TaxID=8319 RepID=A0AAV7SSE4_PLEWA|nr:hypothetical protein NDU88_007273 [Pleurodeles waltl]